MREEIGISLLPLDELQQELSDLENGSFTSLTDGELHEKIRTINEGFVIHAPIVQPGTIIYRAVKISKRPTHKSRISYPPVELIKTNGRLNRVGEVMFYGSFDQLASCLYECSCDVGDFFAISFWLTKQAMMFNHLGYSTKVLSELKSNRDLPFFAQMQEESERNRIFREWQAKVFTKHIPFDQTHLYRLPIALKDYALGKVVGTNPNGPSGFSGIIYPSIALRLLTDNVAIMPTEVDSKLDLIEVILITLDATREIIKEDGSTETQTTFKTYAFARPDAIGNLIWGQKSQVIQTPGTDLFDVAPRLLPPE